MPKPKKQKRDIKGTFWNDKPFNLKQIETWKKYPVKISNKLTQMVIDKSERKLNPEHVKYILGIYFTEMAQYLKEQKRTGCWFINDFGSFKLKTYDKIVRSGLENKTYIKYDLKKISFRFAPKWKRKAYRILNRGNQAVYDYMDEKAKHRRVARRIFGIKRMKVNELSQ